MFLINPYRYAQESWTPADLASLVAWYDASDTSTITESSGAVSQWDDKSANGYDVTQATGANQPTTGATTLNSLNVLDFDGGDFLERTVALLTGNYTVLVVVNNNTDEKLAGAVESVDNSDSQARIALYSDTRTSIKRVLNHAPNRTDRYVNLTSKSANNTWYYMAMINNGTTITGYRNGISQGTVAPDGSTTLLDTLIIGRQTQGNLYLTGSIAEIIICNADLSGTDLTNLNSYITTKWGL